MFKLTKSEIELMEKTVDQLKKDNKIYPCISADGIVLREVEFNGCKWNVKFEIGVQEDVEEVD
ncbi:MAG: hypothetical protein PHS36_06545 [Candidatus Cloacimonetes bacterium]|jgi:hypothetical protein|nr:hypothetical protein [Candidatus Cloacimonadota bacterium]